MTVFLSFFSSAGMDDYPTEYLFSIYHFAYIAIMILLFFILMKIFLHKSEKTRKIFIFSLLGFMLFLKYAGELIFVLEDYLYVAPVSPHTHALFDFRTIISYEVCGINNVLLPLVVFFNWKKFKDFIYTSSILGGLAALLYPVGILYGDPIVISFVMLRSLMVHFLLVFIPIFLIASNEFTLELKNWKRIIYGTLIFFAWGLFGNLVIEPGSNFMYIMRNPFYGGPIPLLNILPDGVHLIILFVLLGLGFSLIYFVIFKIQKHRDKNLQMKSTV